MYRSREPKESPIYSCEEALHQSIVVQDARGDYYYYGLDPWAGADVVAKFRSTRGTMPEDFVRNHFKGAIMGVDMDQIHLSLAHNSTSLMKDQAELVNRRKEAESQSGCMCAKLMATEPYKSKFSK